MANYFWRRYLEGTMLKQILTEADGMNRASMPIEDIMTMVAREKARSPLAWKQLDWDFDALFASFGLSSPERVASWKHFSGKVIQPCHDGICNSVRVIFDDRRVPVDINEATRIQTNALDCERAHVFAEEYELGYVAHAIVSDAAYQLLCVCDSNNFKKELLSAFLDLNQEQQEGLCALQVDSGFRRSMLYCASYFASKYKNYYRTFTDQEFVDTGHDFNTHFAAKKNCPPVSAKAFIALIRLWLPKLPDWFAMYANMVGCSVWHERGRPLSESPFSVFPPKLRPHISRIAQHMLTDEQITTVVGYLIDAAKAAPLTNDVPGDALFDILRNVELPNDMLQQIAEQLFAEGAMSSYLRHIGTLVDGPNGLELKAYILERYHESCAVNKPAYYLTAAAIRNYEAKAPAKQVLDGILAASSKTDFLLHTACLGLLLWHPYIGEKRVLPRGWVVPDQVLTMLLKAFEKAGTLEYVIVGRTLLNLLYHTAVPSNILDSEAVRSLSLKALLSEETDFRAEHILCFAPNATQHLDITEQERGTLLDTYDRRLESLLASGDAGGLPHVSLAVLFHLGKWKSKEEQWAQLSRILNFYSQTGELLDHNSAVELYTLVERISSNGLLWQMSSSLAELSCFEKKLSSEKMHQLQVQCSPEYTNQPMVFSTPEEVLEALKFLGNFNSLELRLYPHLGVLLKNARLQVAEPGSFLITEWFRYLCIFDLGREAITFYRTYRDILDRPHILWFEQRGRAAILQNYLWCQARNSRVADAISGAIAAGSTAVLKAFFNSEFRGVVDNAMFAARICYEASGAVSSELAQIYEGRYGFHAAAPTGVIPQHPTEEKAGKAKWKDMDLIPQNIDLDSLYGEMTRNEDTSVVLPMHAWAMYYDDLSIIHYMLSIEKSKELTEQEGYLEWRKFARQLLEKLPLSD